MRRHACGLWLAHRQRSLRGLAPLWRAGTARLVRLQLRTEALPGPCGSRQGLGSRPLRYRRLRLHSCAILPRRPLAGYCAAWSADRVGADGAARALAILRGAGGGLSPEWRAHRHRAPTRGDRALARPCARKRTLGGGWQERRRWQGRRRRRGRGVGVGVARGAARASLSRGSAHVAAAPRGERVRGGTLLLLARGPAAEEPSLYGAGRIYIYIYIHICICICVYIYICIYRYRSFYIYLYLYMYLSIYLSIHLFIYLSIFSYLYRYTYR